jgi:hypothetical protein
LEATFIPAKLSYPRLGAVCGNHKTSGQLPRAIEPHANPRFVDLEPFAAAHHRLEAFPQRVLERRVLDDVGERRDARAIGVELDARVAVAVHAHGVHGR